MSVPFLWAVACTELIPWFLVTNDIHTGKGDISAMRDDQVPNRKVDVESSNVLFHIVDFVLAGRARPISRYYRRMLGGTTTVTTEQAAKILSSIGQRCSVNAVLVSYPSAYA